MKKVNLVILSLVLLASSEAADRTERQWIKMVLTRVADGSRKQVVMGPLWVRELGTAHFTFRDKSVGPLVIFVSPRLTTDGPVLSLWAEESDEAVRLPPNPRSIPITLDSETEFELGAGKFRVFVTLEAPKHARQ